jgi:hypothetical protein
MTRVGPKMVEACMVVSANPGCTKQAVSQAIGPHGSQAYGWAALQRAIGAGLIEAREREGNRWAYSLTVTELGKSFV